MALVITRKSQRFSPESDHAKFRVGDDVIITILGWKGDNVRIAIEAPTEVVVFREEIYQRIRAEVGPDTPIGPDHRHAFVPESHENQVDDQDRRPPRRRRLGLRRSD